jgi:Uma2 family endonuclease
MALSQITWDDVQQLSDDGHRHEAIEGELHVTPSPTPRHQDIVLRLALRLQAILVESGHGRLFLAPLGVEFPESEEGVQPDLVFISSAGRARISDSGIVGAPDLVVEVLSPTTEHRDRGIKRKLYERQGVDRYWIVDPDAEVVEAWTFGERPSEAPALHRYAERLPVHLGGETLGEIDLLEVFRKD